MKKKKITATIKLTDNSTNNLVNWSSSDNTILTIDSDGTISGVKEGSAIVTVSSQDEPDKKASIPVAINKPIVIPTSTAIPTPTPSLIATPTPIPTIVPTPTILPNPTPTPILVGKILFSFSGVSPKNRTDNLLEII